MKPIEVKCPDCKTILIVDPKTSVVLEVRKPLLDEESTTGDRFEDARKLVESADERIAKKVEEAKKNEREKMDRLDALFNDRKQEIQSSDEPIEKPDGLFGRD